MFEFENRQHIRWVPPNKPPPLVFADLKTRGGLFQKSAGGRFLGICSCVFHCENASESSQNSVSALGNHVFEARKPKIFAPAAHFSIDWVLKHTIWISQFRPLFWSLNLCLFWCSWDLLFDIQSSLGGAGAKKNAPKRPKTTIFEVKTV